MSLIYLTQFSMAGLAKAISWDILHTFTRYRYFKQKQNQNKQPQQKPKTPKKPNTFLFGDIP